MANMLILRNTLILILLLLFVSCRKSLENHNNRGLSQKPIVESTLLEINFDCNQKKDLFNSADQAPEEIKIFDFLSEMFDSQELDLYEISTSKYSWATFVNDNCSQNDRSYYLKCKDKMEKKFYCLKRDFLDTNFWLIKMRLKTQNPFIIQNSPLFVAIVEENGAFAYNYSKENKKNRKLVNSKDGELSKQALTILSYGGMYLQIKKELKRNPNAVNEIPEFFGLECRFPLKCAKEMCHKDVVELLIKAGAKDNSDSGGIEHCNFEQKP